jgi:DHA2 family multidrug resistance protein-like MFS transporter
MDVQLAGRREWLGLAVLAVPTLLVAMDMTALFLALPALSADLGATSVEQLWISDSYGFMVAGFVITMGTLGDRIGRRRLLMIGGAAFAVVSVLAAYAPNPQSLIAARVLLGVAGATLMPSTLALISTTFRDGRQRGKAIAVWATCQFTGGALGPVLAGFLMAHFWWGSVFLVAVPAMAVLLVVGPAVLPEYRDPAPGRLDLASVGLSLVAVLLVVYSIKQLTVSALPVAAVGVLVGVVFVRRQLRLANPLLDVRLFANRPFTAVLIALVLAGIAMAGVGLLVTQYLQSVLGYSPLASALLLAPMGFGVAAGTLSAPALASRMSQTTAIAGGLVVSVLGSVLVTQGGLVPVLAGITVLALGTGPLFALGTSLVIGSVPRERAGSAASMSETSNYFGGSIGIALIGTVAAVVFRARMPAGGPPTLAAATGTPFEATARAAFTSGLTVAAVIAAVLFSLMAALVLRPALSRSSC